MWGTTTSGTGDGYAGKLFQSTPPRGGATQATKDADSTTDISIHVFHAGNNPCPRAKRRPFLCYFNPRFLAGATLSIEQQRGLDVIPIHATFAGGRLPGRDGSLLIRRISIHAPRAGATAKAHKFGWHFCSKQRRFPGSILLQGYYTGYFFRKQLCCGGILGAKGVGGDSGHQRRRPVYFLAASCVMLTLFLL